MRHALCKIDARSGHILSKFFVKIPPQRKDTPRIFRKAGESQVRRHTKSGDRRHIFRTGAEFSLLSAAEQDRDGAKSLPDIERAGAFGA